MGETTLPECIRANKRHPPIEQPLPLFSNRPAVTQRGLRIRFTLNATPLAAKRKTHHAGGGG
jgi:hypothetical protein